MIDPIQMVLEHGVVEAAIATATLTAACVTLYLLQMFDFVTQPRALLVYHIQ